MTRYVPTHLKDICPRGRLLKARQRRGASKADRRRGGATETVPCEVCDAEHESVAEHNQHMADVHGEAVVRVEERESA